MADVVGRRNAHVSVVLSLTTRGTSCVLRETRSQKKILKRPKAKKGGRSVAPHHFVCRAPPLPPNAAYIFILSLGL